MTGTTRTTPTTGRTRTTRTRLARAGREPRGAAFWRGPARPRPPSKRMGTILHTCAVRQERNVTESRRPAMLPAQPFREVDSSLGWVDPSEGWVDPSCGWVPPQRPTRRSHAPPAPAPRGLAGARAARPVSGRGSPRPRDARRAERRRSARRDRRPDALVRGA